VRPNSCGRGQPGVTSALDAQAHRPLLGLAAPRRISTKIGTMHKHIWVTHPAPASRSSRATQRACLIVPATHDPPCPRNAAAFRSGLDSSPHGGASNRDAVWTDLQARANSVIAGPVQSRVGRHADVDSMPPLRQPAIHQPITIALLIPPCYQACLASFITQKRRLVTATLSIIVLVRMSSYAMPTRRSNRRGGLSSGARDALGASRLIVAIDDASNVSAR